MHGAYDPRPFTPLVPKTKAWGIVLDSGFFDRGISKQGNTLIHELSHIYGTDDGQSGLPYKNAHNWGDLWFEGEFEHFASPWRNALFLSEGQSCCPNGVDPPLSLELQWPNN